MLIDGSAHEFVATFPLKYLFHSRLVSNSSSIQEQFSTMITPFEINFYISSEDAIPIFRNPLCDSLGSKASGTSFIIPHRPSNINMSVWLIFDEIL